VNTHVYFIYFDLDGSGRFLPLLKRAWDSYKASRCQFMPWVLTDETTRGLVGYPVRRVSVQGFLDLVRPVGTPGRAFDYKSTLILQMLSRNRDFRMVFLDCDNIIRKDMTPEIEQVPPDSMAMAECPNNPIIVHPSFPKLVWEKTSACLVFPGASFQHAQNYVRLWQTSKEPDHPLLEQRTWSLVWHRQPTVHQYTLPRTMSWSRFWGPCPDDVIIHHPHGEEKWS
jgi:hypothetical protein